MKFFYFLFLLFLLGCSKKEAILTFAVGGAPNEVEYWEKLIKDFENKNQIDVKLLRQPSDTDLRRQGLVIPLKAKKNDPDIFLMDIAWIAQFAASNWLLPLNHYIKREKNFDINNLFIQIVNQVDVYKGKIIALPVYVDCGLLYFRKDLLKKYNLSIPKTWKELLKYAKKIQKEERKKNPYFYGFVWQGAQYEGLICNFIEFIASNEGKILNKNITLAIKENIEALQFMKDLIHKHKISPPNTYTEMKEEETRIYFEKGNALFERNWPYAWKLHNNSSLKGKIGITILPKFKKHATALGGWHIGISRYSDRKEDAWKLLNFILSYNIQKRLALDLGWNPARKDIYDDPEIKEKMPHIKILKKALMHAVARPNIPYYTQISEILQKYINAAISKNIKPEKALERAEKEIKKIEKAYHE